MKDDFNDEDAKRRITSIFKSLPPDEVRERTRRVQAAEQKPITNRDGVVIGGDVGGDVNITVNTKTRAPGAPKVPPPPGSISVEQRFILKEKVDLIARLSKGRETHQKIWTVFKRRYKVSRYEDIPASQFDDAAEYLRQWAGNARRSAKR